MNLLLEDQPTVRNAVVDTLSLQNKRSSSRAEQLVQERAKLRTLLLLAVGTVGRPARGRVACPPQQMQHSSNTLWALQHSVASMRVGEGPGLGLLSVQPYCPRARGSRYSRRTVAFSSDIITPSVPLHRAVDVVSRSLPCPPEGSASQPGEVRMSSLQPSLACSQALPHVCLPSCPDKVRSLIARDY